MIRAISACRVAPESSLSNAGRPRLRSDCSCQSWPKLPSERRDVAQRTGWRLGSYPVDLENVLVGQRNRVVRAFVAQKAKNQSGDQIREVIADDKHGVSGGRRVACCLLYTSDAADDLLC